MRSTTLRHTAFRLAATAGVLVLATAGEALAQGCAMCGSSFGQNDPVTNAFSWSVLFLMAVPYTIAAVVGAYFFLAYRRPARRDRAGMLHLAGAGHDAPRPKGDLA